MRIAKRMLAGVLAAAVILVTGCADDDAPAQKNQFKFEGAPATSLKGATLYLVNEAEDDNSRMIREYAITNGEYLDGDGLSLGDYTGADYLMVIRIRVGEESGVLTDRAYGLYHELSTAPETADIAWLSFTTTANVYYEVPDDAMGQQQLDISGDFDHRDTMTIRFSGTLTHYTTANDESADGSLYFNGEVADLRFM